MLHKHTNRLIHSASPYLLQHAHNPVNWFPWGEEAFEKAKQEDKLVLVSIGYSACHWCHVMEHESFEDEETASLMNEHFICIKVDREERPDVDQVYMDAVQLISGRGGWPLNMFTLPDGKPLHGGTYFPKHTWQETLKAISNFYNTKKEEALQFAAELTSGVERMDIPMASNTVSEVDFDVIKKAVKKFKINFDITFGGYNWAPKFPLPTNHLFFLQYALIGNDEEVKQAVMTTLIKMAEGGIYDQCGGGFARYSTDSFWKVPHFEKMLYDNGQLMSLYAEAYKINPLPLFKRVIYQTSGWVTREMTHESGAFFSALDADSEGVEGKFYLWTKEELKTILGEDELIFSMYYNVQRDGNWEYGANILFKTLSDDELEKLTRMPIESIETTIAACHQKLLRQREYRIRPGLDDKIICSWNALMTKGFADAYAATGEKHFLTLAENNITFILRSLFNGKKLFRIYKNGTVSVPGFAEDYALLCDALLKMYEVTLTEYYLYKAHELMQLALVHFYDKDTGFFRFTPNDGEQLAAQKFDVPDNVIPSSNSVLAKCLFYLSFYFNLPDYREKAIKMAISVIPKAAQSVSGYSNWMHVLLHLSKPFYQVICTGPKASLHLKQFRSLPLANTLLAGNLTGSQIPLLADKTPDKSKIYVCVNQTCLPAVTNVADARAHLLF
jgi:uncharacterized protein YyaL (SSP411 family)